MFVLIGILTICSAGFNHLVVVVKMGNWLISFNVIEIASIFSVFATWFCIYTCLRSLYCMAGCIQKISLYLI